MGNPVETRLKALMRERHWTYSAFCREYDRAAGSTAPELTGTAPSRAQLHRWMSGQLKGLPFPDHCRMLEKMFPGWTVQQLFELVDSTELAEGPMIDRLVQKMSPAFGAVDTPRGGWGVFGRRGLHETPAIGRAKDLVTQQDSGTAAVIAKRLLGVAQLLRLDSSETAQLAGLAGGVVELGQTIAITVDDDGAARITYSHELFNMSDLPLTRFAREIWFQRTSGALNIVPTSNCSRRVAIQRIHDTADLAKFACRVSPAIHPGEIATVGYSCTGGTMVADYFWRQAITNFTRHLTMTVRQSGVRELMGCSAVEEHSDGGENSATEDLLWDLEEGTVAITFTRDYLSPGQALTLRWEVEGVR